VPPGVEVCAVQPPGREGRLREAPFRRIEPLLEALLPALAPKLDRPFAVYGHSMGAVVAFELVRALRRASAGAPRHLFVSGHVAPQLPEPGPPLHPLSDAAFVAEIRNRYDGIPEAILRDPEYLQLFLPTMRADLELIETYDYRPEAPLACPLVAYGGREDPRTSEADLDAWRTQTAGPFALRMFPGGHFFVQSARPALVEDVTRRLATTLASGT
jgi:medium-chain acyl-[acyl-carrier-protein] hydrolase